MPGSDDLKAVLRERYGVADPAPRQLPDSWNGNVFHQSRPGSAGWVVRILDQARAAGDAQVLSYLEQMNYPAPRLIRTVEGLPTVSRGSQALIVTTFIPGAPADLSLDVLYGLGQRLGHLHTIDLPSTSGLPLAEMRPVTDMAKALDWLRPLGPFASQEFGEIYQRLLSAVGDIDTGEDLPRALIHNDAHPGNAVVTADNLPMFIDWSGAGLGQPMIDLGFLLISSEVAISWAAPIPPAAGRVDAIVDGYASFRIPTQAELSWLPDAMQFRGLLYGATHLADAVARGQSTVSETWWWDRHEAARILADRARRRFEQHS
jgi:Ser/Thr protein kinase RdoA (MazF antagonist)